MRKNPYARCRDCDHWFWHGEARYSPLLTYSWLSLPQYICMKCSERENMIQTKQLKITAEVDGKQVPLETISTETFEAIKTLEKQKEIPVARLANYILDNRPRLLFRPTENIDLKVGRVYGLDLVYGITKSDWNIEQDEHAVGSTYINVRSL